MIERCGAANSHASPFQGNLRPGSGMTVSSATTGTVADEQGILPDHMIAGLARDGAIVPARNFEPDQSNRQVLICAG